MPIAKQKITPCLWFDAQAEEAAKFYTAIFANSRITKISRYTEAGRDVHGKAAGSVLTVEFELDGETFTALNGGPHFKVQRSGLVSGDVRGAGRSRLFLAKTERRRSRRSVRLAEG